MNDRSKRVKYAKAVDAIEQKILDAMPDLIDGLIKRASEGDVKAAQYLMDRVLGKVAGTKHAPAEDYREPAGESSILDRLLGG